MVVDDEEIANFPNPLIPNNPDWTGWYDFGAPYADGITNPGWDNLVAPFDQEVGNTSLFQYISLNCVVVHLCRMMYVIVLVTNFDGKWIIGKLFCLLTSDSMTTISSICFLSMNTIMM